MSGLVLSDLSRTFLVALQDVASACREIEVTPGIRFQHENVDGVRKIVAVLISVPRTALAHHTQHADLIHRILTGSGWLPTREVFNKHFVWTLSRNESQELDSYIKDAKVEGLLQHMWLHHVSGVSFNVDVQLNQGLGIPILYFSSNDYNVAANIHEDCQEFAKTWLPLHSQTRSRKHTGAFYMCHWSNR